MSGQRFPIHKTLRSCHDDQLGFMLLEQLDKVSEEMQELGECMEETSDKGVFLNASGLMEEALDVIHAAEGVAYLLERMHPQVKMDDYVNYVIEKNKARGYYDA